MQDQQGFVADEVVTQLAELLTEGCTEWIGDGIVNVYSGPEHTAEQYLYTLTVSRTEGY